MSSTSDKKDELVDDKEDELVDDKLIDDKLVDDKLVDDKLKWSGYRDPKTTVRSGYTVQVCISALQKYIRRCDVDKALMVTHELWDTRRDPMFRSVWGNFKNRLLIISVEDVGPANPKLIRDVLHHVQEKNLDNNLYYALRIVERLARSKKSRLTSHVCDIHMDVREVYLPNGEYAIPDDALRQNFFKKLKARNISCFQELNLLLAREQKLHLRETRKISIWNDIDFPSLEKELVTRCRHAYFEFLKRNKKKAEPHHYLILLVILEYFPESRDSIVPDSDRVRFRGWTGFSGETSHRNLKKRVLDLSYYTEYRYNLVIDEHYIYDKHVPGGNPDIRLFYQQGALVNNQCSKYFEPYMYDYYIHQG